MPASVQIEWCIVGGWQLVNQYCLSQIMNNVYSVFTSARSPLSISRMKCVLARLNHASFVCTRRDWCTFVYSGWTDKRDFAPAKNLHTIITICSERQQESEGSDDHRLLAARSSSHTAHRRLKKNITFFFATKKFNFPFASEKPFLEMFFSDGGGRRRQLWLEHSFQMFASALCSDKWSIATALAALIDFIIFYSICLHIVIVLQYDASVSSSLKIRPKMRRKNRKNWNFSFF